MMPSQAAAQQGGFGQSMRSMFRHHETPHQPAENVWGSMRNLHANTNAKVFLPIHTKVEKFTKKVGSKVGQPVGHLLFLAYKVAPLTLFLICAPAPVVTGGYVLFFLTIKVTKIVSPETYEKYANHFAGPLSVATKYFAIYAGFNSFFCSIVMAFGKTDPRVCVITAAIYAVVAIDLAKLYAEMCDRIHKKTSPPIAVPVAQLVHTVSPSVVPGVAQPIINVGQNQAAPPQIIVAVPVTLPQPVPQPLQTEDDTPAEKPPSPRHRRQSFVSQHTPRHNASQAAQLMAHVLKTPTQEKDGEASGTPAQDSTPGSVQSTPLLHTVNPHPSPALQPVVTTEEEDDSVVMVEDPHVTQRPPVTTDSPES